MLNQLSIKHEHRHGNFSNTTIKVLLLDSRDVVRWGLYHILESQVASVQLVGCAETLSEGLTCIRLQKPDVVIVGSLPGTDILDVSQSIKRCSSVAAIALFDDVRWYQIQEFLESGGIGCISIYSTPSEYFEAIRSAAFGKEWISPSLRRVNQASITDTLNQELSGREREIATLVAQGFTSKQIAEQLAISSRTVETHRRRISKKLGIQTRAQLVSYIASLEDTEKLQRIQNATI